MQTWPKDFAPVVRSALVLCGVAVSCALAIILWSLGDARVAYVASNEAANALQRRVFWATVAAGGIVFVFGLGWGLFRSRFALYLRLAARRLAPLLLVAFLPALLDHRIWEERPLEFCVIVLGVCLLAVRLTRSSLEAWALSSCKREARVAAWCERLASWARSAGKARLPLVITLMASAAFCTYFANLGLRAHWEGGTSAYDLGIFHNIMWNTAHGSAPIFKASPLLGPTGGHLGHHATFFAFVLAPLYWVAPHAETLIITQAVLVGAAAIPLFFFARRRLSDKMACLLAVGFLLHPAVHGPTVYHFHFLTLAPVFVFTVAYALDAKKLVLAAVFAILALSLREDIGIGLSGLGAYYLLSMERPRPGLVLALVGLAWSACMKLWVMPQGPGGSSFLYMYQDLLPEGATSAFALPQTILANPVYAAHYLITAERLTYALQMLVPVLFLPALRPLSLILLASGALFTVLTSRHDLPNSLAPVQISFQYTAHLTPYLFIGTTLGLERLRRKGGRRYAAWVTGLVLALLMTSHQFGAVLQHQTARAGFLPMHFEPMKGQAELRRARRAIVEQVPPRVPVAATDCLVPYVADRPNAYTLGNDPYDAEYIVAEIGTSCGVDLPFMARILKQREFGVVDSEKPFVLLRRGADPQLNPRVLKWMRKAPRKPR